MSRISEVKTRVERLIGLGSRMKSQLTALGGPAGEELKGKLKESGKRIAIGAAVALFGLSVIAVAAVYIIAVVTLLVNIALDRLWLSALIVVFGSFLLGGIIVAVGISMLRKGAGGLKEPGEEVVGEIKSTGEEIKETLDELQEMARKEAEARQQQLQEAVNQLKVVAPYLVGAYLGYRLVKGVVKARRKRFLRQVKELIEEEEG
ncbi:phage holin family protein [Candidatus Solincola sp.]|nr:phage holin family protein [Actinomycetota bacterium]MDI7252872.1 phage holin family protein [Actinomycetota bacterium]